MHHAMSQIGQLKVVTNYIEHEEPGVVSARSEVLWVNKSDEEPMYWVEVRHVVGSDTVDMRFPSGGDAQGPLLIFERGEPFDPVTFLLHVHNVVEQMLHQMLREANRIIAAQPRYVHPN